MTQSPETLVIEGATVLTGKPGEAPIENGRIVVRDGRFADIGRTGDGPAPSDARVVDAAGMIATPGFINVHTHAVLCLMRGVAEDMGFAPAYTRGVPRAPMISPDEAAALAALGALEALKFGSTLICDTYVHPLRTTPAIAALGGRVVSCNLLHDVDFAGMPEGRWDYDPGIGAARLSEVHELAARWHGAEDGRVRVQMAPHAPDTCSTGFLREVARANEKLGLRCATHLCQSRIEVDRVAARDGVTPVELLEDVGLLDDRLVAAHCIMLTDGDIARIARAGVHVAHVPKGNAGGGMVAPTMKLRAAGASVALATDNLLADMTEAMRWALCMGRVQAGAVSDDWQPEDVFDMATMAGARAMGLVDELGSIEPGKRADLVLFDATGPQWWPMLDTVGVLVHCGQGASVRHVLVDGRFVVEQGRAVLADEAAIRTEAQAAAQSLWDRARRQAA